MKGRISAYKRGYNAMWRKARLSFLHINPLCKYCLELDIVTPASVVDHIVPHKGDNKLFWDMNNWQALCKFCHDSVKQKEENGNSHVIYDDEGNPIGLDHW